MPQNQSSIRFSLEELIWFKKGQEVEELLSISLDPHITIQELEQYVVIKGNLYLSGEYIGCGEEEGEDVLFRKYVQAVQYREEDGIFEFYQSFPVDVTIPKTRIADIEELDVNIEGFDYQFHGTDCLKINADIAIEGILQDGDEEEDEAETAPYPDLNGRETYLDEPDAAYQAPFSHSEWGLAEQEEESAELPRHFIEEAESFEEVPFRADEEKAEEDESHADPELYTPFTIESRVVPEESVAQPEPFTNGLNVLEPVELPEEEEESLLPETGGKRPESASWQAETAAPVRDEWHGNPAFSSNNESASLAESGVVQDEWQADPELPGKNESASLAESGVARDEWHAEPEFSSKNEPASIAESESVRNEWQADPVRDEWHPDQELSGETASVSRTESKTALNEESLEPDDSRKTEPVFRIESKAMEDESSAYIEQESPEKYESSSEAGGETMVEESPESEGKTEEEPEEKDSAAKKKKKQKYESISLADFFARRDEEKPAKLKVCIVQSGETLDQLAEKYNINVQQILRMNHLEVNQDVYEGQVLYVPANARAEKNH